MTLYGWFWTVIAPSWPWLLTGVAILLFGSLWRGFRKQRFVLTWIVTLLVTCAVTLSPVTGQGVAFFLAMSVIAAWILWNVRRGVDARRRSQQ